jgi:hypothetical protein
MSRKIPIGHHGTYRTEPDLVLLGNAELYDYRPRVLALHPTLQPNLVTDDQRRRMGRGRRTKKKKDEMSSYWIYLRGTTSCLVAGTITISAAM